jgi:hypothetical protein
MGPILAVSNVYISSKMDSVERIINERREINKFKDLL